MDKPQIITKIKNAVGWLAQSRDNLAQAAYNELQAVLNDEKPEPAKETPKKQRDLFKKKKKDDNQEENTEETAE